MTMKSFEYNIHTDWSTRKDFIRVSAVIFPKAPSSEIKTSFSLSISLLKFRPLLLKNSFIVFQNFLLSVKSFTFSF